jgi:ribosomal protein S18 acetylase RimI-like enzyme
MAVRIRPLTPADRSRWEELFRARGRFYKLELAPATVDAVWGWIFGGKKPVGCDVALDQAARSVGIDQHQLMHRSLGGGLAVDLSDLYVDPAIRSQRTGSALIEHVIAIAKARWLPGVRWLTQESNDQGRMLDDSFAPRSRFVFFSISVT